MFEAIPNTGTFGDDRFDRLRSAALIAVANEPIPGAVIDYVQALEQRVLDAWFAGKREFAKSSWEQFRPNAIPPSGAAWVHIPRGTASLSGTVVEGCVYWRPDGQQVDFSLTEIPEAAAAGLDPCFRGVPMHFWRPAANAIHIWPTVAEAGTLFGVKGVGLGGHNA